MPDPVSVQALLRAEPVSPSQIQQRPGPDVTALAGNSRVIWGVIAAMAAATIIAYRAADLSYVWTSGTVTLVCVLTFLTVSGFYRRFRPDPSVIYSTESCALSYPLATTGFPYRDDALNAADVWMGLDWRTYLHFVNDRPLLSGLIDFAYRTMLLQFGILVVSLVAASQLPRLQQYALATALALSMTLVIFAFAPAGGTYAFLHIAQSEFSNLAPVTTADQLIHIDALRTGQQKLINGMEGLITFPSFHTVWAILFMWGFYPVKQLRYSAIVLNLLVIASTPIEGAHYFVDLAGGAIVAAVAIYGAVRFTRSSGASIVPRKPLRAFREISGMTAAIKS